MDLFLLRVVSEWRLGFDWFDDRDLCLLLWFLCLVLIILILYVRREFLLAFRGKFGIWGSTATPVVFVVFLLFVFAFLEDFHLFL